VTLERRKEDIEEKQRKEDIEEKHGSKEYKQP